MVQKVRLMSRDLTIVLKRRLWQSIGLCIIAMGVALTLALISFHPHDPSLNIVGGDVVHNLLSWQGAYYADLMYQSFGLGAYIIGFVFVGWGVHLIRYYRLENLWLHLLGMICTIILTSVVTTQLPTINQWSYHVSSGGFWGDFLFNHTFTYISHYIPNGLTPYLHILLLIPVIFLALIIGCYTIYSSFTKIANIIITLLLMMTKHAILQAKTYKDNYQVKRKAQLSVENIDNNNHHNTMKLRPKLSFNFGKKEDNHTNEDTIKNLHTVNTQDVTESKADDVVESSVEDDGHVDNVKFDRKKLAPLVMKPRKEQNVTETQQENLNFDKSSDVVIKTHYEFPPLSLLEQLGHHKRRVETIDNDALEQNARMLESVLNDYGVRGEIIKVRPGPVVTLYELEPAPGVKTSRVIGLADDIARSMSAVSVRIATVPGRSVIGIEMPNNNREMVHLHALLSSKEYHHDQFKLPLILGKDIGGTPIITDLATMPHLLIAGTTGSGKSVGLNAMILSLLYRHKPEECKFIMIDPKMLELSVYDDIPHLLSPVVTDPKKAVVALKWTVREMEERYRLMSKLSVRNIDGYNKRAQQAIDKGETITRSVQTGFDPNTGQPMIEKEEFTPNLLPYIVVVVDEMADLMLVAGKEIEASIQRLAQMARAAGIHIIMATQRPSVDVITGTIKANFPTRISFMVTSKIDSRTILGEQGAEQLLGRGDMLYMGTGGRITRVHGPFCEDSEVESVCNHLRAQALPQYIDNITDENEFSDDNDMMDSNNVSIDKTGDDLYDQAIALVIREQKASTSFVQRHLQIGYNRAARIIEQMEKEGIISTANHVGKRDILVNNNAA